jgi:hypothetical protein
MDDRVIERLIAMLRTAPEIYLPLGTLWQALCADGLDAGLTFDGLRRLLEADKRFEILTPGSAAASLRVEIEALEPDGPLAGPAVKLAERPVTTEAVMTGLSHNLEQLSQAIQRAWQGRPAGDAEAEAVLQEVLGRVEELEKEIRNLVALQPDSKSKDDAR